jgi:hypothetical protein
MEMDSSSQKMLMALLQSLLDKQCSWPALEPTTVSRTQLLAHQLQLQPVLLALHFTLTQFLLTSQTFHVTFTCV